MKTPELRSKRETIPYVARYLRHLKGKSYCFQRIDVPVPEGRRILVSPRREKYPGRCLLRGRSSGVMLKQFWDGNTPAIEMRGSLCWSMITYPLVSGNFNVSVGDISARRMERWDPNIMAASIPWERIRGIAEAVEFSTAGRAKPSKEFERMTEKMRSRREVL